MKKALSIVLVVLMLVSFAACGTRREKTVNDNGPTREPLSVPTPVPTNPPKPTPEPEATPVPETPITCTFDSKTMAFDCDMFSMTAPTMTIFNDKDGNVFQYMKDLKAFNLRLTTPQAQYAPLNMYGSQEELEDMLREAFKIGDRTIEFTQSELTTKEDGSQIYRCIGKIVSSKATTEDTYFFYCTGLKGDQAFQMKVDNKISKKMLNTINGWYEAFDTIVFK